MPYGVVPKVAVRAFVGAGRDGTNRPTQVWLSKLNASLMKEGTADAVRESRWRATRRTWADSWKSRPVRDFTSAGGVVLSDFGPRFVALLADVLQHPALPASELPRLKADLARQLAIDRSRPGVAGTRTFPQDAFPGSSLRPRLSERQRTEGLHASPRSRRFYRHNFAASRTHLYVAGKLEPAIAESDSAILSAVGRRGTRGCRRARAAGEGAVARS